MTQENIITKDAIKKFRRIVVRNQVRVIGTSQRPDSIDGKYAKEFKSDRDELVNHFTTTITPLLQQRERMQEQIKRKMKFNIDNTMVYLDFKDLLKIFTK